jgi:hypothetical protein
MPVTQRDLAHTDDTTKEVDLLIQVGNTGIGDTVIKVGGNFISDSNGTPTIFKNNVHLNLGIGSNLVNKEIEIETKVSPNPAIADKTMIVSYDLSNATFITGKPRTLKIPSSANTPSDTFFVTITIL